MKKLVLFLAVAFSVSLFSCGGSEKATEAQDTTTVATETEVLVEQCDSCCGDSACVDTCAAAEAEVVE